MKKMKKMKKMKFILAALLLCTSSAYAQDGSIRETTHQILRDEFGLYQPSNLATTATSGFLPISSCPGVPTGVPTSTADQVVWDSTDAVLYVYAGGWNAVNPSAGVGTLTQVLANGNATGAHDISVADGQAIKWSDFTVFRSAAKTFAIEDGANLWVEVSNPSHTYLKVASKTTQPLVLQTGDGSSAFSLGGNAGFTVINLTGASLSFGADGHHLVGPATGLKLSAAAGGPILVENPTTHYQAITFLSGQGLSAHFIGPTDTDLISTIQSGKHFTITGGVGLVLDSAHVLAFGTRGYEQAPSDGVRTLLNNVGNDFDRIQLGGTTSSFPAIARSTTHLVQELADGTAGGFLDLTGTVAKYGNVATAGIGIPAIVASNYKTGETGDDASVVTFTPAVDGEYEVSAYVKITTGGAGSFSVVTNYTDEASAGASFTTIFTGNGIGYTTTTTVGTVAYAGLPGRIHAKGGTPITVTTSGTYTGGIVYNIGADVKWVR